MGDDIMSGIGMGVKYSWGEPPTFFKMPGEYDYMADATSYNPKDLSSVEKEINYIIDNIFQVVKNCSTNLYAGNDLFCLVTLWNTLFKINGQEQEIVNYQDLTKIGDDTEYSFSGMKKTVNTYFSDASTAISNIKDALQLLEDNANKVATAKENLKSEDNNLKTSAKQYLDNVSKNGTEYNLSNLQKIGKWVF